MDSMSFIMIRKGSGKMEIKKHLSLILESLHDPVIIIDKEGYVTFINKAYTKQFDVPKEKILGKKLKDIEENARILEVLKSGEPLINNWSYVRSLKKHIFANITPLLNEVNDMIGVITIMKDISEMKKLEEELEEYIQYTNQLQEQLDKKNFSLLQSESFEMKKIVSLAKKVSGTDATVLLTGESGVGKEIFARAIHEASPRHEKAFIAINVASIPDTLFESELFGYEEGSFTGSKKGGKKGLLEQANGGTLFLDEVSEMSLNLQVKLLRVIQEREFHRVGGTKTYPLDVRIICATHRDLQKEIKKGNFREDLYYRINVVPIHIPPLRERKEDIPFLIDNILKELTTKYMKHVSIDSDLIAILQRYDWPGNVRELHNVIERMLAVSTSSFFKQEDIPPHIRGGGEASEEEEVHYTLPTEMNHVVASLKEKKLPEIVEEIEQLVIKEVLKESRNRTEAIERIGISRKAFYAKLKKYGLSKV